MGGPQSAEMKRRHLRLRRKNAKRAHAAKNAKHKALKVKLGKGAVESAPVEVRRGFSWERRQPKTSRNCSGVYPIARSKGLHAPEEPQGPGADCSSSLGGAPRFDCHPRASGPRA